MPRTFASRCRAWIVALSVAVLAASAWAQDYTVTTATGKLETRPAGAVALNQQNYNGPTGVQVALPFSVPYYGRNLTSLHISPSGFVIGNPNFTTIFLNPTSTPNAPGRDPTSGAFPYSSQGTGGSSNPNADGVIAPIWGNLAINPAASQGDTYYWTSGVAPLRHFVVSWDNFAMSGGSQRITAQVHMYEGTGRIVFAYDTNSGGYGTATKYVCGIDSFGDSRFTCPLLATNQNSGYPGSDFVFDPRSVTYTGTLQFDLLVSDPTGIGNSTDANQPIGRCTLELRRDGGIVAVTGVTADDGTFSITGLGIASSSSGTLAVLASNPACVVSATSGGAPFEWTANSSLSYSTGSSLGTTTLGAPADASGATRAPFGVARACLATHAWVTSHTTAVVPRLTVLVDPTKAYATTYQAGAPPVLYVGSGPNTNPDVWDGAIVTRTYARHVLASIAALPASTADDRFDAISDPQNAFAEAFGYWLWSAVSGSSQAVDGKSASMATVYDLETPTITAAKGSDVTGRVAGALHDLLDGANETIDTVDGTSAQARVLQIVDSFTVTPTAATFLQAWVDAGYDAGAITRVFVGNGVLADDAGEPNDSRTEASPLGGVGVRHAGALLNRFNEDWYSVTLPSASPSLQADVKFDRISLNAAIALEIRDGTGALLASGAPVSGTGAIHAATAPLAAGTYTIGVRHISGVTIPNYTVQSYVPLAMSTAPLTDWTIDRPYDRSLGVGDGIAPYTVSASPSAPLPPGLAISPLNLHVIGTPTGAGVFPVTIQLHDDGDPANTQARTQTITIHDAFKIPVAPFVGFPAGRNLALDLPTTGGTTPFTLSMTTGALPSGLSFDPNSLHVTGSAAAQRSTSLELDGFDVAGSSDHVAMTAVVAAAYTKKGEAASLVAGPDACGWWFDAVEGSTVSFGVATAKKQIRRALTGMLLGPDRAAVETGTIKAKSGSLAGSKFVCPASGRYFVIASSTDMGAATQLLATITVAPPKGGKAKIKSYAQTDTTTLHIGAQPGAVLTLKFTGDKKPGLTAKVISVTDPSGTQIVFPPFVTSAPQGGTLTMTLATGGTWTVVLGANSTSGSPGKFSYGYTIKQPKVPAYSAD